MTDEEDLDFSHTDLNPEIEYSGNTIKDQHKKLTTLHKQQTDASNTIPSNSINQTSVNLHNLKKNNINLNYSFTGTGGSFDLSSGLFKKLSVPHIEGDYGLENPMSGNNIRIAGGLCLIVEAEGPMLAKRAYDVYLRHCGIQRLGRQLKSIMNRAMQYGINTNKIVWFN